MSERDRREVSCEIPQPPRIRRRIKIGQQPESQIPLSKPESLERCYGDTGLDVYERTFPGVDSDSAILARLRRHRFAFGIEVD